MKKSILVNEIIKMSGIVETICSRQLEQIYDRMMKVNKQRLELCYLKAMNKEVTAKFVISVLSGIIVEK